jgi:hypothetical protein
MAQEKPTARARRIRLIRRRIVASTLAAFVLAWGVVAFDGSKGTTTTTVASTATTTSATDTSSSTTDTGATMTTSQS